MDSETAIDDQVGLVSAFSAGLVDGAPGPIERLDTHLSHVFLTDTGAFKLKKAVRLPFVDFRTLEQRRTACAAELEVNRRMAPALYLAVSPVTLNEVGGYRLGGQGRTVDWVVVMRRFDGRHQFDHLARDAALTTALVVETAEAVARMHSAEPPCMLAGHAADYRAIIAELGRTEAHGASALNLTAGSSALLSALEHELTRVSPLVERRRRGGKVRRGHGDLHLSNICLFDGAATPFDALEFNERMATSDVLYDIAFLLMDLRRFDLGERANAALNAYWDASGEDEEGLALLGFFMALRSAVMTAVSVEQARLAEAEQYRWLGGECLRRDTPAIVAIGGLSGSGKSTVAKALAPRLPGPAGARLLRTDVLRKQGLGRSAPPPQAYAAEARAAVYRALAARTAQAASAGASVIADATFQDAENRSTIETAMAGRAWRGFWLDAGADVRAARVSGRTGDASDADVSVALKQRLGGRLGPGWRRIDATRPIDEIVADIKTDLLAGKA